MKWRLLCIYLFTSAQLYAQAPVTSTGSPYNNAASFADYAFKKFDNDLDRFSFVYDWICRNVNYDTDSALYFNWSATHDNKIEATLRRKKGVCENYASLLADISGRMFIPAYVVHGFPARRTGSVDDSHAWVAVNMNNDWLLCDPTWDATGNDKRKYFLSSPQQFIDTHIPFDPMWQLLERPLYLNYNGKEKYNYRDSIAAFLRQDSLQQLLSTQQRIKQSDIRNNMSNNWERLNNMNIAIIAGEKDEQLYNEAVKLYNDALRSYNSFIAFRNNGFRPTLTDDKVNAMLSPVGDLLKQANERIRKLGSIRENFQYDPSQLSAQMEALQVKTEKQQQFLREYLSADAKQKNRLLTAGN